MGYKLHVGCGDRIKSGYINIDQFNANADRRIDILSIDYSDGSVERIEGYMVLEHLSFHEARCFVKNAYRMLEPGGILILEVPDIEKVCRLILAHHDDPAYLEDGAFGLRGIFGEPKDQMTPGDYHKWGYTPATARKLMVESGFSKINISDGISHACPIRDMRIEAVR